MKRTGVALSCAVLLLIVGRAAAQSKNIHEDTDPYTGLTTLSLETSTRSCPGDPSPGLHDPDVHLLFVAQQNQDRTVSYFMTPELDQAGYSLSLRPEGTMDAIIDGTVVGFTTPFGSTTTNRYWGNHSFLHETIPFSVSRADLARLGTAKSLQFRVNGPRQEVQRCANAKNMRELGEFLDHAQTYGSPRPGVDAQSPTPVVQQVSPSAHPKKLVVDGIETRSCPDDPALGPHDADVRLTISADRHSDGALWYFISTDLFHGATVGLRRGDKLLTKMDGVSSSFNTINGSVLSSRSDVNGLLLKDETIAFHVHQADLIALSEASSVEFRIGGPDGAIHRCADSAQFKGLSDFLSAAALHEKTHLVMANSPASR